MTLDSFLKKLNETPQEVAFTGQKTIDITLLEDESPSDTFNVLYTSQKKSTNLESVAEINYENGVEKKRQQINAENKTNICDFRNDGTATLNLDGGDVEVKWAAVDNRLQVTPERGSDVFFNIKTLTKNELLLELEDDVEVVNGITYRETLEWKMRK